MCGRMHRSTPVLRRSSLVRSYTGCMHGRIRSQTRIDTGDSLDTPIVLSIAVNSLIILTTIHAQDFYDEIGDRLQGRQTLPIVWQEASRIFMLIMTLAWSFGLLSIKPINQLCATAFFGLGALVGMRFYFQRDVDSDRTSFLYYNVGTFIPHCNLHEPDCTYQCFLSGLVDDRTGNSYTFGYAASVLN